MAGLLECCHCGRYPRRECRHPNGSDLAHGSRPPGRNLWRRMMVRLWVSGLAWSRSGSLLGTIAGVALAVALLASLGTFLGTSAASMTARAIASIPVDWQV